MKVRKLIASVSLIACSLVPVACGGNLDNATGEQPKVSIDYVDVGNALKSDKDITLSMWAWSSEGMKPSVAAFEKKYPHIKIDLKSTGASADHYIKVQNAIKAQKGLPDIVQLEYDYLPQYAVQGALLDLNGNGIDENIGKLYNEAAWSNVHVGDGIYGIPQDQAPITAWYRTDILQQYGIEIPTTWKEYEQAGIKLHKADSSKYLGFIDTASNRQFIQMLHAAGAQPWKVDGLKNINFDLTDEKATQVAKFTQRLIDEGVLAPVAAGTDEFNRAFADGKYASWIDGAWRGGLFSSGNPELKGKLQAALPPSWGPTADSVEVGEAGGSLLSVTAAVKSKEKQAAALAFINWINSSPESIAALQTMGGSLFCAAKAFQNDSKYSQVYDEYFSQKVNEIYFEAAKKINTEWSILPYNNQMDSDFKDILVPQMKDGGDIAGSLTKFQDRLKKYGQEQGFAVE